MITFAICDDEAYMSKHLKLLVDSYTADRGLEARVVEFSSGEALLSAACPPDVILLDMKLPGKNGIAVMEQLRREQKKCVVIFISSFKEYALQAFEVSAVHYLLKPVSDEKLFQALDRAVNGLPQSDRMTVTINRASGTQVIFIRDILYCEVIDHKVYIYTSEKHYEYFGTLEALCEKLDERFFRCHKSYIVNLACVISREQDMVTVTGGKKVLVSRRKQQEFTQRLLSMLRKEVL